MYHMTIRLKKLGQVTKKNQTSFKKQNAVCSKFKIE